MLKICLCIAGLTLAGFVGLAQPFKVFLVGDAGEDEKTGPTLLNLGKQLRDNPRSAVIFLGDNSYKSGLGDKLPYGFKGFDSSHVTQNKVQSQLSILDGYRGYVYFVPGNHDWWNITDIPNGEKKLRLEENFIDANLRQNSSVANPGQTFLPSGGQAGPAWVDLPGDSIRLIFIDSYRLILENFKRKDSVETAMEHRFYQKLDSLVRDARLRKMHLVVAAHHTVYARGPHTQHMSNPYLFARIKASNSSYPTYRKMDEKMRSILAQYPGCIYACGHVHSLQYYFPPDSVNYIISGAGSKTIQVSQKQIDAIKPGPGKEWARWNEKGFFEVEFSRPGPHIWAFSKNGTRKEPMP